MSKARHHLTQHVHVQYLPSLKCCKTSRCGAQTACLGKRITAKLQADFLDTHCLAKLWSNKLGSVKPVNSRLALRIAAGLTPAAECRCFDVLSTEIYVQVALRASNNTISSTFASSFLVIPLHVHCICFLSSAHAIVDDRLPAIPRGAHIGHVRRPRTYCLWDISTCPGSQHRHCQCTMPQMAPPSPRAQPLRSCSRQRHSRGAAHPRYVTLATADCLPSTR